MILNIIKRQGIIIDDDDGDDDRVSNVSARGVSIETSTNVMTDRNCHQMGCGCRNISLFPPLVCRGLHACSEEIEERLASVGVS